MLKSMLKNDDVKEYMLEVSAGLEYLVDDPSSYFREEVAKQGVGLDRLVNDPNPKVRIRAREEL